MGERKKGGGRRGRWWLEKGEASITTAGCYLSILQLTELIPGMRGHDIKMFIAMLDEIKLLEHWESNRPPSLNVHNKSFRTNSRISMVFAPGGGGIDILMLGDVAS